MSNQIKITTQFAATAFDTIVVNTVTGTGQKNGNLTGSVNSGLSQSIATTYTRLNTGSVSTPIGYYFIKNLETASMYAIDIAALTGSATCSFATLQPQEFALIPSHSSSIYIAKAQASASVLQVCAVPR